MKTEKKPFHIFVLPNSTYILVVTFLLASALVPKFLSPGNITTLLTQACVMMILSTAMSICLMMGCIDLSLGGVLSMSGVVMAMLLSRGASAGISILIGLLCGTLFGALNGIIVAKLKVAPFIATFGAAGIAQSLANTLSQMRTISWASAENNKLIDVLGSQVVTVVMGPTAAQVLSISMLLVITAVIIAIVLVAFKKTTLGSNIYAIGANEEAALLSGIFTTRWKIGVYMLSGFLAAVGGLIVMVRTNSLQPTVGDGLEFQAIVAAVLGGNSMRGGKGSIPGAVMGALTLYTVRNSMTLLGIDTSVVMVVIGCILVFGMLLNEGVSKLDESHRLRAAEKHQAKRREGHETGTTG